VAAPECISSRNNPLFKELRKLSQDNTGYRKAQRFWVEGEHLCLAVLGHSMRPALGVYAQSFWASAPAQWMQAALRNIVLSDALFDEVSNLESPAKVAFVLDMPPVEPIAPWVDSVILDRVQDAGNVGSILRSAAAFGFGQVLALKGTAALWSPKVLRAGMGAHFRLQLHEGLEVADLAALQIPLLVTSSHQGGVIHQLSLPSPCAWAMGHEGQGVRAELMDAAQLHVRIAQPGGEESLNVAAAAAICLHASSLSKSV
jgi:TrmH family RNA methyltransferase